MSRLRSAVLACALVLAPLHARAGKPGFSGNVALTSDYLFRGVSQTLGDPALQATLRYDTASGLYAAGSTSNVDYGDANDVHREVDAIVGFARSFGPVALDVSHVRYAYLGADPARSLDYSEWVVSAGLGERWSATAGWSGDVFATGHAGTYTRLAYRHPLGARWALHAAAAHYRLGGGLRDYRHGEAGATWTHGRWSARLALHGTSAGARADFGSAAPPRRLEATVAIAF